MAGGTIVKGEDFVSHLIIAEIRTQRSRLELHYICVYISAGSWVKSDPAIVWMSRDWMHLNIVYNEPGPGPGPGPARSSGGGGGDEGIVPTLQHRPAQCETGL